MKDKNNGVKILVFVVLVLALAYFLFVNPNIAQSNDSHNQQTTTKIEKSNNNKFAYFNSKEEAIEALNNINIAEADNSTYNASVRNDEWGGWKEISGWNTREEVLLRDASIETHTDKYFESGVWNSPYTGEDVICEKKEDVSKNIQIDHIIPVAYVHRHGGASWDQDKKQEYYNDYGTDTDWTTGTNKTNDYKKCGVLVAVDSHSNMQKSDKGPSEWMPSNEAYAVEYCEEWIVIANNWGISLSKADYDVILNYISSVQ